MNIHTRPSTTPLPGNPSGWLGRTIVATVAASLVVAAVVGAGLWSRGGGQETTIITVPPPPAPAASFARAYAAHTVYIAASAGQATELSAAINDANAIRSANNDTLLADEVLVAATDGDAAALVSAETDANAILAALYGVENRIVDMRG